MGNLSKHVAIAMDNAEQTYTVKSRTHSSRLDCDGHTFIAKGFKTQDDADRAAQEMLADWLDSGGERA